MRGFWFRSSLGVFGLRPKLCWPAADQAPRHTREKAFGTQGSPNKTECKLIKRVIRLYISFSKILLKFESKDIGL